MSTPHFARAPSPIDIRPLAGRFLGRAHIAPADLASAALGRPTFGPAALLADLELRLGLPTPVDAPLTRLDAFRATLAAAPGPFAASLAIDPWGTARTALAMRDALALGGFDRRAHPPITTAGPRVAALTALDPDLPPAEPERLAAVLAALDGARAGGAPIAPPYAELTLRGRDALWPGLWRRVFARLAALGCRLVHLPPPEPPAPALDPRVAPPLTDLAALQRFLADPHAPRPPPRGDGTLVLATAETPEPLADALAAFLASAGDRAAVLRTAEHAAHEAALAAHGLPRLGGVVAHAAPATAAWLPLILRLARAPFDPEAALDLVLQPGHGLSRYLVDRLAAALADAPGLGSRAFARVAPEATAAHPEAFARLLAWLTPEPRAPAPAAALARRLGALDDLLRARFGAALAEDGSDPTRGDGAALEDALALARHTLAAVLAALPPHGPVDPAPLDALLGALSSAAALAMTRLEAGTLLRADTPEGLCAPVDTLVWWGFVTPPVRPVRDFRKVELDALARAGVALVDPRDELHAEAEAARHALCYARRRVVLAFPARIAGEAQSLHPLWSELVGRLGWSRADERRLTCPAAALPTHAPHVTVPARALPPPRTTWQMPAGALLPRPERLSMSRLQRLFDCPLAHVLDVDLRLRRRATGAIDTGPKVLGHIGHLLVERLHLAGRLQPLDPAAVAPTLAAVLADEASFLLLPGRAAERRHAEAVYTRAVHALARFLADHDLRVVAVEEEATVAIGGALLTTRSDLRVADPTGALLVVDLKWSTRSHLAALRDGRALQLAAYVAAHPPDTAAAYFGFMRADTTRADATRLADTRRRMAATLPALSRALGAGLVPVTGMPGAPPLGEALALPPADHLAPAADACRYCDYRALCGRHDFAGVAS